MHPQSTAPASRAYPNRQNADLVAVYARVSSDNQEKQQTIDTQLFKIDERLAQEGWRVHDRYLDNPYTGTVINRPALDRLMDDARAGSFDRVLMYDPDRLSRGAPWMRGYLEEQLARAGVRVVYLSYVVEDSKEGRAKDGMVSVFNVWERETIVQRMKDGRERRIKQGHLWRGPRPFGWVYVKAGDGAKYGHLELHPTEAPIVREVFDLVLAGKTTHWIAAELNRRGVVTTNGKGWVSTNVSRTIHQPLHTGRPAINRYVTCEPDHPQKEYRAHARSSNFQRPRAAWQYAEYIGAHIVSEEEWQQAEARLAANRSFSPRNAKREYLLSGLLKCGREVLGQPGVPCGHRLHGAPTSRRQTHFHYRCNRHYPSVDKNSTCCKGVINAWTVETLVWGQIKALLAEPDLLLAQMDKAGDVDRVDRSRADTEVTAASQALEAIAAKLKNLLSKNLTGAIDDATYEAVQADLVGQRVQAQQRHDHALGMLEASAGQAARWADAHAFCLAVRSKVEELELPEHFTRRRELLRTLIQTVWVHPDGVVIEGALPAASTGSIVLPTPWC